MTKSELREMIREELFEAASDDEKTVKKVWKKYTKLQMDVISFKKQLPKADQKEFEKAIRGLEGFASKMMEKYDLY